MSNVEWLLREVTSERTLTMSMRNVIDDDQWRAAIERIDIGAGLRVFLTKAEAKRATTVEVSTDRPDQWIGSQVTIAGRADIDFCDGVCADATPHQALLFRTARQRAAYSLNPGAPFHSAGYSLDLDRLRRLFDDEVPEVLTPLFCAEPESSRIVAMRGDKRMRHLASGLFAPGLNGPLRTLMMEGAVLQLLAAQVAAATRQPMARVSHKLTPQEQDAIHAARELLLADMRHPPSLHALAMSVGLTERRLNAGFRAVFGSTVFETLRNERLAHARIVLAESDRPLKAVAFRVGYNYVTNFISAFTARYGMPPSQYRAAVGRAQPGRKRRC